MIRTILPIILLAILALGVRAGDMDSTISRVELRATVRLHAENTRPTLGDLARIEGVQAEALKALPIELSEPIRSNAWTELELMSIREQIKQAPSINSGAVIVTGTDVRLIQVGPRPQRSEIAAAPEPKAKEIDYPTLRKQIERWTLARLDINADKARFRYRDGDEDLLNTRTSDRIVEIREIGRSEQMVLGVVVYENERVVLDQSIRFELLIERPVRVAQSQIKRSSTISQSNTKIEHRWLGVTEPIADPDRSIGMITRGTIDPGSMIFTSSLEAPILVERGQIVNARSIAGSVSVSLLVRAREGGRLGDIIKLESRDRSQQFQARVAGPGRVVIMHNPATTSARSPSVRSPL